MSKTVFLAGASGVIGMALSRLLINAGYTVYGTTRRAEKVATLEAIGVKPVVVDVYDEAALREAVVAAKPDIVQHQLTDLPHGLKADEMEAALVRNARLREVGTANLVKAAEAAGASKFIAQSLAFVYAPSDKPHTEESALLDFNDPAYGETAKAVHSLEQQTLNGNFIGVVLRNGLLYGTDTGIETPVEGMPSLHIHAAALAAFLAIEAKESGIYNVADPNPNLDTSKFAKAFPEWRADFRL